MPKWLLRCSHIAILTLCFGHCAAVLEPCRAAGDTASSSSDTDLGRRPFPPRGAASGRFTEASGRSSSWWLGTVAVAVALAVVGGLSVAARRFAPVAQGGSVSLRVVGRTSLSPRHAVYLVHAGGRTLVLGTGPQGPPSLLGELDDDDVILPASQASDRGGAA